MKPAKNKKLKTAISPYIAALALTQMVGCASISKLDNQQIDPTVPNKIAISAHPTSLGQAGRVIAHEDGPFNFIPFIYCRRLNPCPNQLTAMIESNRQQPLERQIHFVKLSIRTLSDGTWVVAHDQVQYILTSQSDASRAAKLGRGIQILRRLPTGKQLYLMHRDSADEYAVDDRRPPIASSSQQSNAIESSQELPRDKGIVAVDLSTIDSNQLTALQGTYGDLLDVYRLEDFVKKDPSQDLNYMLYFKTDPNQNIIDEIDRLGLNDRAVLESRSNDDATWVHDHQGGKSGVFFTGRVGAADELAALLKTAPEYGNKLWAIEVDANSDTPALVKRVNATQYVSHVDSMSFDLLKEALFTACATPLATLQSTTTMTSRPTDCLDKMKVGG